MWKHRLLATAVAIAALLTACKPPALTQVPTTGQPSGAVEAASRDPHAFAGVVEFPERLSTQATSADVVNAATLQMIDPATNLTVVSGIMTNGGGATQTFSLTIPSTFAPALNQVFLLEAVKGLGSNVPGNEAVRLRTYVQWTAAGWTSITGSATIALTAMTTAVALISSLDPANVPPVQTIGDVTYNLGTSTFTGTLPGYLTAQVNSLTTSVKSFLAGDVDPVGNTSRIVPQVTGLSANRGAVSEVVAVYGDGFSPVTNAATVSFNGVPATTYLVRSRTALFVTVPNGATTGNVTVTTTNGTSNGFPFMVMTPQTTSLTAVVTGLSRNVVRRGDTLVITGYNFDPNSVLNTVTLNGNIDCPVTGGGATWLSVTIPNTAISGPLTVSNVQGVSGAHYLGVLTSATLSLIEPFTSAGKRHASTTMAWSNTGSLNIPATVNWSQSGAQLAATSGANFVNTFSNTFPKGGGIGLLRTANSATYTQTEYRSLFGVAPHQTLATNGNILLGLNSSGQLYAYKTNDSSTTNQETTQQYLGYPFLSEPQSNVVAGIAGLWDSDTFYYANYGATLSSLKTLIVTDYGFTRGPTISLPITINKYSTHTYGHKLGSNGVHLYIWGGQATGYTAYSSYVYVFAIEGTTATLVRAIGLSSVAAYPENGYNYYPLTADDRFIFLPGYSTYPYSQWFLQSTGAYYNWTGSMPFNTTTYSYGFTNVYDIKNDCYWVTNPYNSGSGLAKVVMQGSPYSTARDNAQVTSPAITLPAGQVWDKLNYSGILAPNTTIKLEVLNGATNALLYTAPLEALNSTISLKDALAGYTGSIKLRAWLSTDTASLTPILTKWGVTSAWSGEVVAQSTAYDTAASQAKFLSYTLEQPASAPVVAIQFADSADGTNWGPWTAATGLNTLGRRYLRWRVTMPGSSTYVGPLVNRLQIDYQN